MQHDEALRELGALALVDRDGPPGVELPQHRTLVDHTPRAAERTEVEPNTLLAHLPHDGHFAVERPVESVVPRHDYPIANAHLVAIAQDRTGRALRVDVRLHQPVQLLGPECPTLHRREDLDVEQWIGAVRHPDVERAPHILLPPGTFGRPPLLVGHRRPPLAIVGHGWQ